MELKPDSKETVGLNDVADIFRRRWPTSAAVFLAVLLTSIVISYSLEDLYASAGRIDIEEADKSISIDPLAERDRELRIMRINDDVMSRDNLAPLVEKHNLYAELRGDNPPQAVVWRMRENIELEIKRKQSDAGSRELGPVIGLSVTFFDPDPQVAKNVSRDLQDLFLNANLSRIRGASVENIRVLEEQQQRDLTALEQSYEALTEFKKLNPGVMPDDIRRLQGQIERKEAERVRVDEEIRRLDSSANQLRAQLSLTSPYAETDTGGDELAGLQKEYIRLIGLYGPDHPDVQRVKRQIESLAGGGSTFLMRQALEEQLGEARRELGEISSRLAPDHPDYRAAERRVRGLEQQLASMPAAGVQQAQPTNPAYINLKLQLDSVLRELGAQRARRDVLERETSELEGNVVIAPDVEQELVRLTRDIELLENQYRATTSELEAARKGEIGIGSKINEYWVVSKVPSLPFSPAYPNRPLYITLGVFIGLTLGIGAGLIAEALDGTIRSTRDVRHVMQMPPIAAIPVIKTETDRRRDRFRRITATAVVLVAVGAVGLYVKLQTAGVI